MTLTLQPHFDVTFQKYLSILIQVLYSAQRAAMEAQTCPEDGNVPTRLSQCRQMMQYIRLESEADVIVVVGDFNSYPIRREG